MGRPTSRPASGPPLRVCPGCQMQSRVWRRSGMSLWPCAPPRGWRGQCTSCPPRRLAWLPWGSANAVTWRCPSLAGRSRRRRASSAPTRNNQAVKTFWTQSFLFLIKHIWQTFQKLNLFLFFVFFAKQDVCN